MSVRKPIVASVSAVLLLATAAIGCAQQQAPTPTPPTSAATATITATAKPTPTPHPATQQIFDGQSPSAKRMSAHLKERAVEMINEPDIRQHCQDWDTGLRPEFAPDTPDSQAGRETYAYEFTQQFVTRFPERREDAIPAMATCRLIREGATEWQPAVGATTEAELRAAMSDHANRMSRDPDVIEYCQSVIPQIEEGITTAIRANIPPEQFMVDLITEHTAAFSESKPHRATVAATVVPACLVLMAANQ